eukprot:TRINITY_DN79924_c0_g1_i1.p1 TRINITY_DN79924_c0_g1~~TRINITY_DN79924_c0_g1_i1.p1  ORF type:complete len:1077 (-),score=169.43 TRINITY_DN79924_c0_g1_i1:355-3585(-)
MALLVSLFSSLTGSVMAEEDPVQTMKLRGNKVEGGLSFLEVGASAKAVNVLRNFGSEKKGTHAIFLKNPAQDLHKIQGALETAVLHGHPSTLRNVVAPMRQKLRLIKLGVVNRTNWAQQTLDSMAHHLDVCNQTQADKVFPLSEVSRKHKDCRRIQSVFFRNMSESCKKARDYVKVYKLGCTPFEAVYDVRPKEKAGPRANRHALPGMCKKGPQETRLEQAKRMKKHFEEQIKQWKDSNVTCKEFRNASSDLNKTCEPLVKRYADKKQECDILQNTLDAESCVVHAGRDFRGFTEDFCKDFKVCMKKATSFYFRGNETVANELKYLNLEWDIILRIECMLDAVDHPTDVDVKMKVLSCKTLVKEQERLNLKWKYYLEMSPKMPSAHCDKRFVNRTSWPLPGTSAYIKQEYEGLPEDAPATNCTAPCCKEAFLSTCVDWKCKPGSILKFGVSKEGKSEDDCCRMPPGMPHWGFRPWKKDTPEDRVKKGECSTSCGMSQVNETRSPVCLSHLEREVEDQDECLEEKPPIEEREKCPATQTCTKCSRELCETQPGYVSINPTPETCLKCDKMECCEPTMWVYPGWEPCDSRPGSKGEILKRNVTCQNAKTGKLLPETMCHLPRPNDTKTCPPSLLPGWDFGAWGPNKTCPSHCGMDEVKETRRIYCMYADGTVTDHEKCKDLEMPEPQEKLHCRATKPCTECSPALCEIQSGHMPKPKPPSPCIKCDKEECCDPTSWIYEDYATCNSVCGVDTVLHRNVSCQVVATGKIVDDKRCCDLKPCTTRHCPKIPCNNSWSWEKWDGTFCAARGCGQPEFQDYRKAVCMTADNKVQDDRHCNPLDKPPPKKMLRCKASDPCMTYRWAPLAWSSEECPLDCGSPEIKEWRKYICMGSDGKVALDSFCEAEHIGPKPPPEEYIKCHATTWCPEFEWVYKDFKDVNCSVKCGLPAVMEYQDPYCMNVAKIAVAESNCLRLAPKPPRRSREACAATPPCHAKKDWLQKIGIPKYIYGSETAGPQWQGQWVYSSWLEACDTRCGAPAKVQTRPVTCQKISTGEIANEMLCCPDQMPCKTRNCPATPPCR